MLALDARPSPRYAQIVTQTLPGKYTEGDQRPDLTATVAYDATGRTYTMTMKRPDDTLLTKTATIVSATSSASVFTFEWDEDDLQAGDRQLCEISETDEDGKRMTWPPFFINVRARNA
jgi:hypothetical protein